MSSMHEALCYLRQQSFERGFRGALTDFDIVLCEDQRTVSVWSHYYANPPLIASFDLPAAIDPSEFDAAAYYAAAERYAAEPAWLN